jgi:hypothetical protein
MVTEIKAMQAIRLKKYCGCDITTKIDAALALYVERLLDKIRSDYRDIIRELDMLVVCGGGAYLAGDALKAEYKRVTVLPSPEFANVKGYVCMSQAGC